MQIEEHLVFDNAVYSASTSSSFYKTATQLNSSAQGDTQVKPEPLRTIKPSQFKELSNPLVNSVISLAYETAQAGYGALIFCSSRLECERDALLIGQVISFDDAVDANIIEKRKEMLIDLRSTSAGLDQLIEKTVPTGVAFHRKSSYATTHMDLTFNRCWLDDRGT